MNTKRTITMLLVVLAATAAATAAQAQRLDAIWARHAAGPITLDGVLNEADWAQAETQVIQYQQDAGIPGSGWKTESGWPPTDPTYATLRFLVRDNQLYLGAEIQDQSVGGSKEFNRFDGLLMAIKNHLDPGAPKPPSEYAYLWWNPESIDPQPTGQVPAFIGRWAEWPPYTARTPEQIAAWDAVTVVHGLSNSDTALDTGYTVEMRFDLGVMGYDVTQPAGDIIEWNISIYDTDWFWPINATTFSSNRVWWQSPWGNAAWYNEVRIFARPDVTVASGPVPTLEPEMVIPDLVFGGTVDGLLNEAVWSDPEVYTFDLRWDDAALRATYDGVGPHRSGQYQPPVNAGLADVLDPADATVKIFHDGAMLHVGFEVRDGVVQFHPDFNRWDGALLTINDLGELHSDNNLLGRRLSFQVGQDGNAIAQDYLLSLVGAGDAQVAVSLMAGTTVDTLGEQVDTGYTAEIAVDLTALGYPADLGDGDFFFGVTLLDGDSFIPYTDSYGTRTWWYREYEAECCAPWARLERGLSAVGDGQTGFDPVVYGTVKNRANPSQRPQIAFALPASNLVTLEIYDLRGRLVERRFLGERPAGESSETLFRDGKAASGTYLYRLKLVDPRSGALRGTLQGKTTVVK
ncbi:MAG: hypothetical protein ABR506_06735 [Candidatus Krumholzibacteriia bacterium]